MKKKSCIDVFSLLKTAVADCTAVRASVWQTAKRILVCVTKIKVPKKGNLKLDWLIWDLRKLQDEKDLILPDAMVMKTNYQEAEQTDYIKHVSTTLLLATSSDWGITICMEQSISQSFYVLYPIKADANVHWEFKLPGGRMHLDIKPWPWLASVADHGWRVSERLMMGLFQVTYKAEFSFGLCYFWGKTSHSVLHWNHTSM